MSPFPPEIVRGLAELAGLGEAAFVDLAQRAAAAPMPDAAAALPTTAHVSPATAPTAPSITASAAGAMPTPAPSSSAPRILAIHPDFIRPSRLAPLMTRQGKPGFVVVDMTDLDEFTPVDGVTLPDAPIYRLEDVERGDELRNWSPAEAEAEIAARERTPLTVSEGISWLLQEPTRLEPGKCFMTIASRKRKPEGADSRVPALRISGGTGRDGKVNKGAPKVGWCWANNRHTWLGFASAARRR